MTISTGRAVIFGQLPVGDVIDRGAELLRGEPGGKIRLDAVTADLLGTRFELEAAGDRRYLLGEHGRDDVPRTLLGKATVCVGRDRELTLLEGTFDECVDEPVARAVLVTAPAGGGKSRLRHEITERLRRGHPNLQILVGRGDAIAAGSPFGLLAPALRAAATITAGDSGELRRQKVRALVTRHLRSHPNPATWEFLGELVGVPFDEDASPALHAARRDPRLMGDRLRAAWLDWLAAECAQQPGAAGARGHPLGRSLEPAAGRRRPARAARAAADGAGVRAPRGRRAVPQPVGRARSAAGHAARAHAQGLPEPGAASAGRGAGAGDPGLAGRARRRQPVLSRGADPRGGVGRALVAARDRRRHGAGAPGHAGQRRQARAARREHLRHQLRPRRRLGADQRSQPAGARRRAGGAGGARGDPARGDRPLRLSPRAAARGGLRHAHRGRSRARPPAGGRVAGEEPGARSADPGRALRARRRSAARGALVPAGRRRGAGAQRPAGRDRARAAGRGAGRHRRAARGAAPVRGARALLARRVRDGRGDRVGRRRLRRRGRRALVRLRRRARGRSRPAGTLRRGHDLGGDRRAGGPARRRHRGAGRLPAARRRLPAARGRRRDHRGDPRARRGHGRRRRATRAGAGRALPGGAGDAAPAPRRPRRARSSSCRRRWRRRAAPATPARCAICG